MEQLFSSIPQILGELSLNASVSTAVVFVAWSKCAGDLLNERTSPINFTANRLVIAVEDRTWRLHLEDLSPTMLVKLNSVLGQGTVKFIEFRIDVDAVARKQTTTPEMAITIPSLVPSLANAANAISDESLRNSFKAAAAVYLDRQRADRTRI